MMVLRARDTLRVPILQEVDEGKEHLFFFELLFCKKLAMEKNTSSFSNSYSSLLRSTVQEVGSIEKNTSSFSNLQNQEFESSLS
jgi:hypothetical protein